MITIYALCEPDNNYTIRYIGLTRDLDHRLNQYRKRPHNLHLRNWIGGLIENGLFPDVLTLEEVESEDEAWELERFWISYCRDSGCNLMNYTSGGERAYTISDEYRENLRVARHKRPLWITKGPMSEETKRKISETRKQRFREGKLTSKFAELNVSRTGIPLTENHKKKAALALRAALSTPEARLKISETRKMTWAEKRLIRQRPELKDELERQKADTVNGGTRTAVSQSGS